MAVTKVSRRYAILCDFSEPDRIHVLSVYENLDAVRRSYPQMRQRYGPGGIPGSRCWVASLTISVMAGQDIFRDTADFHKIVRARILKSLNGEIMDHRPYQKT